MAAYGQNKFDKASSLTPGQSAPSALDVTAPGDRVRDLVKSRGVKSGDKLAAEMAAGNVPPAHGMKRQQ
jgi:hypothetical protein